MNVHPDDGLRVHRVAMATSAIRAGAFAIAAGALMAQQMEARAPQPRRSRRPKPMFSQAQTKRFAKKKAQRRARRIARAIQ